MVCIYCGGKTNVYNSREQVKLKQVWRRRRCLECNSVFSTIEKIDLSKTLLVKLKNGDVKDFSREKLFLSIHSSLGHRQTALTDAVHITDTVIVNLFKIMKGPIIELETLIDITIKVLSNFDRAASTHFAAYNAS